MSFRLESLRKNKLVHLFLTSLLLLTATPAFAFVDSIKDGFLTGLAWFGVLVLHFIALALALVFAFIMGAMTLAMSAVGELMFAIGLAVLPFAVIAYPLLPSLSSASVGFMLSGAGINVVLAMFLGVLPSMVEGITKVQADSSGSELESVTVRMFEMLSISLMMLFLVLIMKNIPSWSAALFGGASFGTPRMRRGGGGGGKKENNVAPPGGGGGGSAPAAPSLPMPSPGSTMRSLPGPSAMPALPSPSGGGGGGGGGGIRALENFKGPQTIDAAKGSDGMYRAKGD